MNRNLKIAFYSLIVLLAIFLFNYQKQINLKSSSSLIFEGDPNKIYKFLIQKGGDAIEIIKNDTLWEIAGHDTLNIKSQAIDNFFNNILVLKKEILLSENPNNYSKYSIDDSTGTHLAIINDQGITIEYFVFGRSQSDYQRCYVRIGDNPGVYLADKNITYMLSTNSTYWGESININKD